MKDKVAIVTGAAKGIGRTIALSFAENGIIPVIVDIDIDAALLVVDEVRQMNITTQAYRVDVSSVEQITQMVEAVSLKFGCIDILVNNAGILSTTSIDKLSEEEWDKVMNINLKGAMFASQQCLKHMLAQGWGRIINISSMAGRMGGFSTGCAYSASKAALIGLTMCMARKSAKNNITVNAVAPGPTETTLSKGFTDEEFRDLRESILVGRMGKPENIADVVLFLASERANFITGAVIDINGGMFMG